MCPGAASQSIVTDGFKLNVWDVGGQRKIRKFWDQYYEAMDALVRCHATPCHAYHVSPGMGWALGGQRELAAFPLLPAHLSSSPMHTASALATVPMAGVPIASADLCD